VLGTAVDLLDYLANLADVDAHQVLISRVLRPPNVFQDLVRVEALNGFKDSRHGAYDYAQRCAETLGYVV